MRLFIFRLFVFLFLTTKAHQLPSQISVLFQTQAPLCGGFPTGTITAIPSGGVPPYQYFWSNASTTNPLANIPAGIYSVTVTDATNATGSGSIVLTEPSPLNAAVTVANCGLPGAMFVTPSGGIPPYDYQWSNGSTAQSISNLNPGEYCVTVMDHNNCGYIVCQYIGTPMSASVTTNNAICGSSIGGNATAHISGGVSPHNYTWNTGQTSQSIQFLPPATYTVTITSYNGCTASASGVVAIGANNFSINLNPTHPACSGVNSGAISATANGGVLPIAYAWSNGQTGPSITNLTAGSYSVTATDAWGCSAVQSVTLINQSSISVTTTNVNPTCSYSTNGSVSAVPTNGVAPYHYLWNTGAITPTISNLSPGTYSVTVTDNVGCTASSSTTLTSPPPFTLALAVVNATPCGAANGQITVVPQGNLAPPYQYQWNIGATGNPLSGVIAGNYSVTVTSGVGCIATGSATISQPTNLLVSITGSNLVCGNDNNGSLTATPTYGTPPYNYMWNNGGNTQTLQNLPAGFYTVTVTSSQGCSGTKTHTIDGNPVIGLQLQVDHVKCYGLSTGKITAMATGGTAPFSYLWSNGGTGSSIENIPAGNYSVTVTDVKGCTKVEFATIEEPTPMTLILTASPGSCGSDGSMVGNITGGVQPYQYHWNTGQTDQALYNLPPGDYSLTVTDGNGCTKVETANIPSYPAVNLSVNTTNTTCNGTTDGTATALATGGTPPFSYSWNTGSNQSHLDNLVPGLYAVTVTDAVGCSNTGSSTVVIGSSLNVTIDAPIFVCPGTLGTATVNAFGGTQPYNYMWSTGQTSETVSFNPGNYFVTVSDQTGCTGEAGVSLYPGGGYNIGNTIQQVPCFGQTNGSISLQIFGGTPPFLFSWNNGATGTAIEGLPAGSYAVTVSDSTGCSVEQAFEVTQPDLLQLTLMPSNGGCGGLGAIATQVEGGTMPYKFAWSTGDSTTFIANLAQALYYLTLTDANGCVVVDSSKIDSIPVPSCSVVLINTISTINATDGQLQAEVTGGTSPFSFAWSNGQSQPLATGLGAGAHTVTVTDVNNCQTNCTFSLLNAARLGDFVWNDLDMDGVQDDGEPGLSGVSILLDGTDVYGRMVSSMTTADSDGHYFFDLQPGSYKVRFEPPGGFSPTLFDQGGDDAVDSDANTLTATTPTFQIGSGENNPFLDAGFFVASPCDNVTSGGAICCDQTLCGPGQQVATLTSSVPPTGGQGSLEYLWFSSDDLDTFDVNQWEPLMDAVEEGFKPALVDKTTRFVRAVRREGCLQFRPSNIIKIEVDSVAIANILSVDTTCLGKSISFEAMDNGPDAVYAWDFGAAAIPSTSAERLVDSVSWNLPGEKEVRLTVTNAGCTSMDIAVINITNKPDFCDNLLIINAFFQNKDTVLVDWYYERTGSDNRIFDLEWAWEQKDFSTVIQPHFNEEEGEYLHYLAMHTEPVRGRNLYRVKMTQNDGSFQYSNVVELYYTGDFNLVHVFPNPFNHYLDVEVIDRFDARISLELFSPDGRQIGTYLLPEEQVRYRVELPELSAGIYFLFVKYNNTPQKIYKLVKR